MFVSGKPTEFVCHSWGNPETLFFSATIGDSKFQSLWEFLTLFMCLLLWGESEATSSTLIQGDSMAARSVAISLRGKGKAVPYSLLTLPTKREV